MSRFAILSLFIVLFALAFGLYALHEVNAAEDVWFTLPVTAGVTTTTVTTVLNKAGTIVRLWMDNDFSTATLTLSMDSDIYTSAPVLLSSVIPSSHTVWLSPNLPISNRLSAQATLTTAPATSGNLGVLMLVDRPRQE